MRLFFESVEIEPSVAAFVVMFVSRTSRVNHAGD